MTEVNRFNQVSSDGHQISVYSRGGPRPGRSHIQEDGTGAGAGGRGSLSVEVICLGEGEPVQEG